MPIILMFAVCELVLGQETEKKITNDIDSKIVIGKSVSLPKPPAAWKSCKCKFGSSIEKVIVQIVVDVSGNVIKANAVSGHPLFRAVSEAAARNSKFSQSFLNGKPQITYGEIIYTFFIKKYKSKISNPQLRLTKQIVKNEKILVCSDCSQTNRKAIILPRPEYPLIAKAVKASGEVQVQLVIDESGNVIIANAVSGHPFLRSEAVKAALKAKFEPVVLSGKPIKVTGVIVYKFIL